MSVTVPSIAVGNGVASETPNVGCEAAVVVSVICVTVTAGKVTWVMTMVKLRVAVKLRTSVMRIEIGKVFAVVGVPVSAPPLESTSPGGSGPVASANV